MISIKQQLNQIVSAALSTVSGISTDNAHVITASRPDYGDYQANGVMAVAKQLKTNPRELAQQVVVALEQDLDGIASKLELGGPGFINIYLHNDFLLTRANDLAGSAKNLIPQAAPTQTIVTDYSSPNLAKEMHVGHLRGTIIGDCLTRILEQQGHHVIRQNHVGDWGTQFGMLITYMQQQLKQHSDIPTALADLESFYREAKQRFDADEEFAEQARASVVRLQSGEADYLAIWQQFIEASLNHCQAVYDKLNISLSRADLKPESFYNPQLNNIIQILEDEDMLTISDGAKCVFLDEFTDKDGTPKPVIIQKSDGGFLYATTDLAAARYRSKDLAADRVLYVVDQRQSLHFRQIFSVSAKAGLINSTISLEHIAYGTMMGEDGKPFKTRSGDVVKLIDLLNESVSRALQLVKEKNPGLDEASCQGIADKVGIAAVKYAELSKNRTSDYVFDWSNMLSFDGNTAPYLMYAYARIRSILRKQDTESGDYGIVALATLEERSLLLKILQFPEIIDTVARDCFPNQLCNYLYELAGIFMRFYEACPILNAGPQTRNSRLALASLTAESLKLGLDLLGIETLEKM